MMHDYQIALWHCDKLGDGSSRSALVCERSSPAVCVKSRSLGCGVMQRRPQIVSPSQGWK